MLRTPQEDYVRLLRRLMQTISTALTNSAGKPERVAAIAAMIAEELRLPKRTTAFLEMASLLHDVGKLALSEHILLKPGPLSPQEKDSVKTHVDESAALVASLLVPDEVMIIVVQHHERFDGGGYPLGLKGTEIHIGARALAVADVVEALTADRPYRKAFPFERAIEIMKEASGSQFDPIVVDALLRALYPPQRG